MLFHYTFLGTFKALPILYHIQPFIVSNFLRCTNRARNHALLPQGYCSPFFRLSSRRLTSFGVMTLPPATSRSVHHRLTALMLPRPSLSSRATSRRRVGGNFVAIQSNTRWISSPSLLYGHSRAHLKHIEQAP